MLPLDLYQGIEIGLVPGLRQFRHAQGLQAGPGGAGNPAGGDLPWSPASASRGNSPTISSATSLTAFTAAPCRWPPGSRLANHELKVVATAGDGDCYGEGGNHLLAALRRNPDLTLVVHNNQVYALTKGQASPTTDQGIKTLLQPHGVPYPPLHALALAVAQDCSWVGRGFAGRGEHLTGLYKQALTHKGFALLEVLQPCVSFNKVNTYQWYETTGL